MSTDNLALRAHVTRVGFDLALGRTHIAALVNISEQLRRNMHLDLRGSTHYRYFANFATGTRGLIERGLLEHTPPHGGQVPIRRIWKITKAGKAVITLLQEAGIYDEYAAAIPIQDRVLEEGNRRIGISDACQRKPAKAAS